MKKKQQKNNWLTITYFHAIMRALVITSSLRYVLASNYQSCETMYSLEVLTTVRKNFILHVPGFLDLPLVIEEIERLI